MAMTVGKRRLVLFALALVMAGLAALLMKVYLDRKTAELEARFADRTEKTRVVVPKRNLLAGTRVDVGDFAIRPMQADMVPPDTVLPGDIDRALGQNLKIALPLGRPLLWGYLSSGATPSFSDMLDEKRRALTIAVDELNSISGMIRPADRIDLFVIGQDPSGTPNAREEKIVNPLLQDVLVKATGNIVRRETGQDGKEYDRRYSTLTLDLLPDEIGKVLIAQENGELKAALKRPEQDDVNYRLTRESDLWPKEGKEADGKAGVIFYVGGKGGGMLKSEMQPSANDLVGGAMERMEREFSADEIVALSGRQMRGAGPDGENGEGAASPSENMTSGQ
jgi:pilus assembly protein CpaB